MKWTGYWMMVVAVLHLAATVALHGSSFIRMLELGVWNSTISVELHLAVWFAIASPFMFLLGLSILEMRMPSRLFGWLLTSIAVIGGVLIPISGFWLLLPPGLAIAFARRTTES